MLTFTKTNIFKISEEKWRKFHIFRRTYHIENTPNEPFIEDTYYKEQMKSDLIISDMKTYNYWIYDEQKIIGTFFFSFYETNSKNYLGNKKLVLFEINLLRSHTRKGMESKALQIMVNECEKHDKEIFISEYQNPSLRLFFNSIGGKIVQVNFECKLNLDQINFKLLQNWVQDGELKNSSTKLLVFERKIPDELSNKFIKVYNDLLQHIAVDDMEMKKNKLSLEFLRNREKNFKEAGILSIIIIAIEKNGEISGLTIVRIVLGMEQYFLQSVTGVPIAFRGRKIAKWMKAKMILYIKEKYPDSKVILTSNSNSNNSILYINTKLGFNKYKELITAQVYLKDIKKYLEEKKEIIY